MTILTLYSIDIRPPVTKTYFFYFDHYEINKDQNRGSRCSSDVILNNNNNKCILNAEQNEVQKLKNFEQK